MMDNITEYENRKRDMKELWKDTFHDSDRYVDLVFDNYYSLENTFVRYHENRLIASLLCVDYEFQILTKKGKRELFKGVYLCGLATRPEWRRKGIMGKLMEEAEHSAKERGIDFAFLIPADNHLREYYGCKGYQTASWRESSTYRKRNYLTDFLGHKLNIYSIIKFIDRGKTTFLDELADFCREIESSRKHDTILHSRKDMLAIMAENENSIFLTDHTFDPEYPILTKVIAIAFPELPERSGEPLKIVGLYKKQDMEERSEEIFIENHSEHQIAYEIREAIMSWFNQSEMQIISPIGSDNHEERGLIPYAMFKLISDTSDFTQNEIPTIEISLMLD